MMMLAIIQTKIATKSMMPNFTSPIIQREMGMNINAIAMSMSTTITLQSMSTSDIE